MKLVKPRAAFIDGLRTPTFQAMLWELHQWFPCLSGGEKNLDAPAAVQDDDKVVAMEAGSPGNLQPWFAEAIYPTSSLLLMCLLWLSHRKPPFLLSEKAISALLGCDYPRTVILPHPVEPERQVEAMPWHRCRGVCKTKSRTRVVCLCCFTYTRTLVWCQNMFCDSRIRLIWLIHMLMPLTRRYAVYIIW